VQASWRSYRFDIWAGSPTNQVLNPGTGRLIDSTPGVASAQPVLVNNLKLRGQDGMAWAVSDQPMYSFHLVSGRLFTAADARARARVVVIEQSIARATSTHVGERVPLATASGPASFTVVGIVSDQQDNGTVLFVPLSTMQAVLHTPGAANGYWIRTTSADHNLIDATNTRLEDAFAAHGVQLMTTITYVGERENVAG
jgi:putative ABC transport system permease protein